MGISEVRVPYWGPDYEGILLFADLYWLSPIFGNPQNRNQGQDSEIHLITHLIWGSGVVFQVIRAPGQTSLLGL